MTLKKLKATMYGGPDDTVTIDIRFNVTPREAAALDALPANVAVVVREIVRAHLAPTEAP